MTAQVDGKEVAKHDSREKVRLCWLSRALLPAFQADLASLRVYG